MGRETKSIEQSFTSTKVLSEHEGIVEAIVAVTGVVDKVNDIIVPGASAKSLLGRKPKGVWSHDWTTPVAKTLEAEEWMPGDPRLPATTRSGDPWPADAGALVVKAQYNLDTQRGREAFSDVLFFGEDQEWSIGYKATKSAVDRQTGIRHIKSIDIAEYSQVLFGAAPLTSSLSHKSEEDETQTFDPDVVDALHDSITALSRTLPSGDTDALAIAAEAVKSDLDALLGIEQIEGKTESFELAPVRPMQAKVDVEIDVDPTAALVGIERIGLALDRLAAKADAETIEEALRPLIETKGYHSNLPGSMEERLAHVREALNAAVRTQGMLSERTSGDLTYYPGWVNIISTFSGYVIFEVCDETAAGMTEQAYRCTWTMMDDGTVDLGPFEKVEIRQTVVSADDMAEANRKALDNLFTEAKIGRVLSASNERRLREAMSAIDEVLSKLPSDVGTESPPADDGGLKVEVAKTSVEADPVLADMLRRSLAQK